MLQDFLLRDFLSYFSKHSHEGIHTKLGFSALIPSNWQDNRCNVLPLGLLQASDYTEIVACLLLIFVCLKKPKGRNKERDPDWLMLQGSYNNFCYIEVSPKKIVFLSPVLLSTTKLHMVML